MRYLCAFVTIWLRARSAGRKFPAMKENRSPDIRALRQEVEGLGATLYLRGSQWFLCDHETEPLGYSIKTERDALQFVLDRARSRLRSQ